MKKDTFIYEISGKNRQLYLMTIPGIILLLLFGYLPLFGIVAAFQDYNIIDGFLGSKFVGFKNFIHFFVGIGSEQAWNAIRNTVILNAFFILTSLIFQISIALAINEIKNRFFKMVTQSMLFLPHFLSWVVVGSIVYSLFSTEYGTVNVFLNRLGLKSVRWYAEPVFWKPILVGANIWKWSGYGSIIYLATISGFDTAYYEAAVVDGASRMQQMRYITLPLLKPTAIVLVLFSIGRIFYGDLVMIYGIIQQNGVLQRATEVIDCFVYRTMRNQGNFSQATAIGVMQSVMGFFMIYFSNKFAKKFNEGEALF